MSNLLDPRVKKTSQSFTENFNSDNGNNTINLEMKSSFECDKIRISVGGVLVSSIASNITGLLIYSELGNNYIGTFGTNLIGNAGLNNICNSGLEPYNGIELHFKNKLVVNGNYNFKFYKLDGSIPADGEVVLGRMFILIEFYSS